MSRLEDPSIGGTDSSDSETKSEPSDSDSIDLTFSDDGSDNVPSETSTDRAFRASDDETLSYFSDTLSEGVGTSGGVSDPSVDNDEMVSHLIQKMKLNLLTIGRSQNC